MTKAFPNSPTATSGELETMRGAMDDLLLILSYARPHGSETELEFLRDFLLPRLHSLGASPLIDDFGNVWATVSGGPKSSGPSFLWSCHVDTVHAKGGRQAIRYQDDGRTLELAKRKPGRCLGADDGAGLWLLLEMIRAGVAGDYVFHRGEEVGRLGSQWVADNTPDRLATYDACVAFDRRDFSDIITHQMGMRCASEDFAHSFSAALNTAGKGLKYRSDDSGSYTDSYSYTGLISECTNVSVGYDSEHGPRETLDALHLWRLRGAMIAASFAEVTCVRDCTLEEYDDWFAGYYGAGASSPPVLASVKSRLSGNRVGSDKALVLDLIDQFPEAVADLLLGYGLGSDEILNELTESELGRAMHSGIGTGWASEALAV